MSDREKEDFDDDFEEDTVFEDELEALEEASLLYSACVYSDGECADFADRLVNRYEWDREAMERGCRISGLGDIVTAADELLWENMGTTVDFFARLTVDAAREGGRSLDLDLVRHVVEHHAEWMESGVELFNEDYDEEDVEDDDPDGPAARERYQEILDAAIHMAARD